MKKYKAYTCTFHRRYDGGHSTHWQVRTSRYDAPRYHRIGGPVYVRYHADGTVAVLVWELDDRARPAVQ